MQRLSRAWLAFWFTPSGAVNLGVCRALFFGGLLLFYIAADFASWGDVDPSFWMPLWLFKRFQPLPPHALRVLQVAWTLSLLLSCLGLFTRASMTVAFLLGLYLLGLPHNFGKTHHVDAILVITMGLLALSRAGDAVSLDRLWRPRGLPPDGSLSGEYTWPIRGACAAYALVLFAAGYAKLASSGFGWIDSDNMAITLIQASYHQAAHDPPFAWNLWIARFPNLCRAMAAGAVAIELAAPLALFSRRARWVLVPLFILLMTMIRLLLGPSFLPFLLGNVFWVNWEWVWRPRSA